MRTNFTIRLANTICGPRLLSLREHHKKAIRDFERANKFIPVHPNGWLSWMAIEAYPSRIFYNKAYRVDMLEKIQTFGFLYRYLEFPETIQTFGIYLPNTHEHIVDAYKAHPDVWAFGCIGDTLNISDIRNQIDRVHDEILIGQLSDDEFYVTAQVRARYYILLENDDD